MRKILAPALALAVVFAFALSLRANELAPTPKPMACTIKNVDTASSTVTVSDAEAKESTYNVDPSTIITIGGKHGTLSDLKVGQTVKLKVDGNKAVSIEA